MQMGVLDSYHVSNFKKSNYALS